MARPKDAVAADKPEEREDSNEWTTIRVSTRTHRRFVECADQMGYSRDEIVDLVLAYFLDRMPVNGFHVESSFLLREMEALSRRIEQLIAASLGTQEALFALEGDALESLIALGKLAQKELPSPTSPTQNPNR